MKEIKYRSKFELLFGQRLLTVLLILLQFALVFFSFFCLFRLPQKSKNATDNDWYN